MLSLRISANSVSSSATIVLITILIPPIDCLEPGARNSNLFPVNANGEVLFLSVESLSISGSDSTPVSISSPSAYLTPSPFLSCSITSAS